MQLIKISANASLEHPVWTRAAVSTDQADPFCCTTAWQFSFHEAFSPERRLLIEESSDSLIAFAEEIASPEKIYLTPIETNWFFGCPLLGGHAVELLSDAMVFIEQLYAPSFPRIIISGLRPDGELSRRLLQTFGNSFDLFLLSKGIQCAASLEGGVDGFLSRRTAHHRNKLKNAHRRASEKGVYFERVAPISFEEAEAAYSRMISVELASWKGIEQCGMAEPPAKQFYDFMLKRLSATKEARVIFAKQEDKDIGFIFGGLVGTIYRGQQFSYDFAWKNFSIGNLMQVEQIKWLCEDGVERYDMGPLDGPRMDYKSHWTEKEIERQTWILERKMPGQV
jgi:hypothetical protein